MLWSVLCTVLYWIGPITYMGMYKAEILPMRKMVVVALINTGVVALINLAITQSTQLPFIWGPVTLLAMILTNWFRIGEQRDAERYSQEQDSSKNDVDEPRVRIFKD